MPPARATTDDDASIDPAQKKLPAWKVYELEVETRLRAIDKLATITYDAKRRGHVSKVERQIDVLAESVLILETTRIVVECKAYKRPLDVGKVDEFIGKLQDLGVGLGLLYTINGVTPAAEARAHNNVLPRVLIRDLSHIVPSSTSGTSSIEIEEDWVESAAEALGYTKCPMETCWGEVMLDPWPNEGIKAANCDHCGALIMRCPHCDEIDSIGLGSNPCFTCGAVYYVRHDGKGEPMSIETEQESVDTDPDADTKSANAAI